MADNIDVTPGAGKTVATDDVGGVQYQLVKLAFGPDGTATWVTTGDPLPVSGTLVGGTTPSDDFANPTTAVSAFSLMAAWDGSAWDRIRGNSTDGLLVNLGANNDVTVTGTITGTVTANAGTNLNTSALALEAGGNLAAINTVLGAGADAAAAAGGTGTVSAKLRRISTQIPAAVGQTTATASLPVVIASDQTILPIAARVSATDGVSNSNILGRVQDAAGNPSFLGSLPYLFNGTSWDRMRGSSSSAGIQQVEVTAAGSPLTYNPNGIQLDTGSSPIVQASNQRGLDSTVIGPTSVTSATTIFALDMTGWDSLAVTYTSIGSSNIVTYETSADNTNWVGVGALDVGGNGAPSVTQNVTLTAHIVAKALRYTRVRVSSYGSGTVTAYAVQNLAGGLAPGNVSVRGPVSAANALSGANLFGAAILAQSANPTAVGNAQAVRPLATLLGSQVVTPYAIPESTWSYAAAGITNSTAGVTIKTAAGANIRNYVTNVQVGSSTLATATTLVIRDGAGGTVLYRQPLETGAGVWMSTQTFDPPLRGTANTLLEIQLETLSATGTVYCNAQGFFGP